MTEEDEQSAASYNILSKLFHWGIAFIIFGMLSVGFYMVSLEFSPFKLQIYTWHKSFGMIVLMLAGLRILWRSFTVVPSQIEKHAGWEKILSKVIHLLLYAAIIIMPLSGWAMSSAGDFPNSFFGLFEFPVLTEKDKALYETMKTVHECTAFALIAAIVLHMTGAFKHHFIDKDRTLKRMTWPSFGLVPGVVLLVVASGLILSALIMYGRTGNLEGVLQNFEGVILSEKEIGEVPALPPNAWTIIDSKSSITFVATQQDSPFEGYFENFGGDIIFDPDNLDESNVHIEIDISSIHTGSPERDAQALRHDWFYSNRFPKAVFEAQSFKHLGNNRYEAIGELTVRGNREDVILPFTLDISKLPEGGEYAKMDAMLELDRVIYGVGRNHWEDGKTIGKKVHLDIHVEAAKP